ncbi:MAG: hypothetical protein AB2689_11020 [Candidatus Thiodiazotropha taylori]
MESSGQDNKYNKANADSFDQEMSASMSEINDVLSGNTDLSKMNKQELQDLAEKMLLLEKSSEIDSSVLNQREALLREQAKTLNESSEIIGSIKAKNDVQTLQAKGVATLAFGAGVARTAMGACEAAGNPACAAYGKALDVGFGSGELAVDAMQAMAKSESAATENKYGGSENNVAQLGNHGSQASVSSSAKGQNITGNNSSTATHESGSLASGIKTTNKIVSTVKGAASFPELAEKGSKVSQNITDATPTLPKEKMKTFVDHDGKVKAVYSDGKFSNRPKFVIDDPNNSFRSNEAGLEMESGGSDLTTKEVGSIREQKIGKIAKAVDVGSATLGIVSGTISEREAMGNLGEGIQQQDTHKIIDATAGIIKNSTSIAEDAHTIGKYVNPSLMKKMYKNGAAVGRLSGYTGVMDGVQRVNQSVQIWKEATRSQKGYEELRDSANYIRDIAQRKNQRKVHEINTLRQYRAIGQDQRLKQKLEYLRNNHPEVLTNIQRDNSYKEQLHLIESRKNMQVEMLRREKWVQERNLKRLRLERELNNQ